MPLDVAITAVALRTALGDAAEGVWKRIRAGETAVGPVRGFDASGLGADVAAAQIWQGPATPEDDPALRILGPHGRLLDAVAREAHAAARLEALPREDIGLFVGAGMVDSPVEDLSAAALASREGGDAMSLASFFGGAYRQIHPLWPLSMLNNVAVGQIAIDLDIRGDNLVLASDAAGGARALLEAARSVDEGTCRAALAAGVSGRISPASLARRVRQDVGAPGEGGAVLVLEREEDARSRGAEILGFLRGGATTRGGQAALDRGLEQAFAEAGISPMPSTLLPPKQLGDLGPAGAAVALALWCRIADARNGQHSETIVALGPGGGIGVLVVEEAA